MGRIEKIVVLTVLFLVALILVISLRGDGSEAGPQPGPLAALHPGSADDPAALPQPEPAREKPAPGGGIVPESGPGGLLNASLQPKAQPLPAPDPAPAETEQPDLRPAAPAAPLPGLLVVTTEGLEPSLIEQTMLYTWRAGDSFAALAQRYYGAKDDAWRLRAANEGRAEAQLREGERLFVPVQEAQPLRVKAPAAGATWSGGSVYVVQSGDMLGTISQTVYGTSKRWRAIFEANQDVLTSPEALRPGMQLRIPE